MIASMSILLVDVSQLLRVCIGSKTFSSLSARIWKALLSHKVNCIVWISIYKCNLKVFLSHNELVITHSK